MTDKATHTPLVVGNGGHAHGAEFEIRTADGTDRYVTGIQWADEGAPECGSMLSYGEAHDMANRIVHAVNSHHELIEALRSLLDEIGKSACADTILDSAAAGKAFAVIAEVEGRRG